MSSLQISVLLISAFIIVMVLATIFKRQQRTVLWSSAILIFTGTLILIGVGVIKLIKNNQPDFVALTGIIVALGGSGVLAYGAEKLHAKMREKDRQILQNASIQQEEQNGVVLTGRLDTHIARKVFAKAIEAGYMEEVGSHYEWILNKVLLAYMCGRIYCEDYPEKTKYDDKVFWMPGRVELFPGTELDKLFNMKDLTQSRHSRKNKAAPVGSEKIDKLFE